MTPARSDRRYLFKVNLKGAKGTWRTIALRGDQTLDDLHEAIFEAFDRSDPHLYSFYFPKAPGRGSRPGRRPKEFTAPQMFEDAALPGDEDQHDAAGTTLDGLRLRPAQRFEYLFDFGDSWWHEVSVKAIGAVEPGARYGVIDKTGSSPPQYEGVDD